MTFIAPDFSLADIFTAVITLSVIAVFTAIFVDFAKFDSKNNVKKSNRSIVATGSMIGFYVFYYIVLRFQFGAFHVWNPAVDGCVIKEMTVMEHTAIVLGSIGTSLIVSGAVINIVGRLQLGNNWANHIRIYNDHTLVINGVYKVVRHPLYSSIMLMLFGGSIAYRNLLSAALTAFVFVPFMYYRAKQEEALLQEEFAEYAEYRKTTGMFLPKLWKKGELDGTV